MAMTARSLPAFQHINIARVIEVLCYSRAHSLILPFLPSHNSIHFCSLSLSLCVFGYICLSTSAAAVFSWLPPSSREHWKSSQNTVWETLCMNLKFNDNIHSKLSSFILYSSFKDMGEYTLRVGAEKWRSAVATAFYSAPEALCVSMVDRRQ